MAARLLGVIQARIGSTRLPGKVLLRVGGETVLARVVRAARTAERLDDILVATTMEPGDDAIVAECERIGVAHHRGPDADVLTRFLGALDARPADAVVRLTADCPLLDPGIVALVADVYRKLGHLDYLSTALVRTLPRGMDVEVIGAAALRSLDELARDHHRAHVTSYVYSHPERYSLLGLDFTPPLGHLRVTLDTPEDWELVQHVIDAFGASLPSVRELAAWLDEHPDVQALNAGVMQKPLIDG